MVGRAVQRFDFLFSPRSFEVAKIWVCETFFFIHLSIFCWSGPDKVTFGSQWNHLIINVLSRIQSIWSKCLSQCYHQNVLKSVARWVSKSFRVFCCPNKKNCPTSAIWVCRKRLRKWKRIETKRAFNMSFSCFLRQVLGYSLMALHLRADHKYSRNHQIL